MNKFFLFFVLSAAILPAFAADETVIVLEAFNARGKKSSGEAVVIGKDTLLINGEKLSSAEIITQSQHIKKIAEFKSAAGVKACEAGHFEHILKRGKLHRKESGCLESERYRELKDSFKALAKDHLTEIQSETK